MNIPRIQIRTSPAKIAMESKQASIEIENPKYPQMDMSVKHVKIQMKSTPPRLLIDQTRPFAESGLMPTGELIADNASYAYSKGLEAIGRIVDQGNQMADFHLGDAIPDQAITNAYEQFVREWNMTTMPRSKPKIDLIRGNVDIQIDYGEVSNNTKPQQVRYSFKPNQLSIYLQQHSNIEISVIDTKV